MKLNTYMKSNVTLVATTFFVTLILFAIGSFIFNWSRNNTLNAQYADYNQLCQDNNIRFFSTLRAFPVNVSTSSSSVIFDNFANSPDGLIFIADEYNNLQANITLLEATVPPDSLRHVHEAMIASMTFGARSEGKLLETGNMFNQSTDIGTDGLGSVSLNSESDLLLSFVENSKDHFINLEKVLLFMEIVPQEDLNKVPDCVRFAGNLTGSQAVGYVMFYRSVFSRSSIFTDIAPSPAEEVIDENCADR